MNSTPQTPSTSRGKRTQGQPRVTRSTAIVSTTLTTRNATSVLRNGAS